MCNFTNMIGGLILYVRAPSLDHFVFENKNVKILFRFCRRHYFDLRIIDKIVTQYREESEMLPPPQLSIASWIAAGLCTTAMYNLATGKPVNYFLKFYFSSLLP